jgi:hypothetical protein
MELNFSHFWAHLFVLKCEFLFHTLLHSLYKNKTPSSLFYADKRSWIQIESCEFCVRGFASARERTLGEFWVLYQQIRIRSRKDFWVFYLRIRIRKRKDVRCSEFGFCRFLPTGERMLESSEFCICRIGSARERTLGVLSFTSEDSDQPEKGHKRIMSCICGFGSAQEKGCWKI